MDTVYTKVNWLHAEELTNGFRCAVSEKSGIVKISFPESYHTVMLFRDQLPLLGITNAEVVSYFERHAASIKDAGQNKQDKKLGKAKQKLVDSIINNQALTDEQKQAMIKLVA